MTLFRILAFTLCVVLVYTLYLPSASPPERFLQQMRMEHELNVAFWGENHAHQILERSLSLYAQQDNLAPAAFASTPSVAVKDVNAAVANQMSDVVQRLFHNSYAQGFDAILLLATYRFSVLVQWLPWVATFVLIACFDGYLVRIIRSKEFLEHSPMRFALCAIGATLALALTLLLLVIPASIHPLALGCVPLVLGTFVARAISHFHR
jgi:Domain of unknown function (DUF4400)